MLALLLLAALIALNFSDQRELTLYFSGMFLFLFLPFASALIGSGAFYSEFKDNAWVYLFSRPIRREKIFMYKYISQLSVLAAIVVLFVLIKGLLPRLTQLMQDIDVNQDAVLGLLSLPSYVVVPLIGFTLAFSLSILYEKQFVNAFVTVLLGVILILQIQAYAYVVLMAYGYWKNLNILIVLFPLSFLAASFLTIRKVDFSQMKPKILYFLKYVILFLALTFLVQTVWIGRGKLFTGSREFNTYSALTHRGDFFASAYGRGMLKYDHAADDVFFLKKNRAYFWDDFSLSGSRIAFFKEVRSRSNRWAQELWIMNTDGTDTRMLLDSGSDDSPFHGKEIPRKCLLSPDGSFLIFATIERTRNPLKTFVTLWWMEIDTRDMKSRDVELNGNCRNLWPFGWEPGEDWICLGYEERTVSNRRVSNKIIKVSLAEGGYDILTDFIGDFFSVNVSPDQKSMTVRIRDPQDGLGKLLLLDFRSGERKVLYQGKTLFSRWAKWNSQGTKLAFWQPRILYVFDMQKDEIIEAYTSPSVVGAGFDWASDRLILLDHDVEMNTFVMVLGPDYTIKKEIPLPDSFQTPRSLWGLKDRALISGGINGGPLWRVDLTTEEWKKVY
jgi:ABC-type transport system involved in multi-copper enzyme maturation permease subunit